MYSSTQQESASYHHQENHSQSQDQPKHQYLTQRNLSAIQSTSNSDMRRSSESMSKQSQSGSSTAKSETFHHLNYGHTAHSADALSRSHSSVYDQVTTSTEH
eukprot:109515_1